MSIPASITAVYRDGIFKPDEPVELRNGTRVRLSLEPVQQIEEDEDLKKLKLETEYFAEQQEQLKKLYPNQYVAIHERQVIDHDIERLALSLRIQAASYDEAVLIKNVADAPVPEYLVRSPRLERQK